MEKNGIITRELIGNGVNFQALIVFEGKPHLHQVRKDDVVLSRVLIGVDIGDSIAPSFSFDFLQATSSPSFLIIIIMLIIIIIIIIIVAQTGGALDYYYYYYWLQTRSNAFQRSIGWRPCSLLPFLLPSWSRDFLAQYPEQKVR